MKQSDNPVMDVRFNTQDMIMEIERLMTVCPEMALALSIVHTAMRQASNLAAEKIVKARRVCHECKESRICEYDPGA